MRPYVRHGVSLTLMLFVTVGCKTRDEGASLALEGQQGERAEPSAEVLQGFATYCGDCHAQFVNDDSSANWDAIKLEATEIKARLNPTEPHRRPMPPRTARFDAPLSPDLKAAMFDAISPYAQGGGGGLPTALPLAQIRMPEGFQISLYAEAQGARSMALAPDGTLFVGTGGFSNVDPEGRVYAIRDTNRDGAADQVVAVAQGLNNPNGVAFKDGDLYIAEIDRILKVSDVLTRLENPPRPTVVNDDLPTEGHHGWKSIAFGPDGKLYVPVGAPCNICDRGAPYAAMHRMNADGSGLELYAQGIRNTVGFAWHPETNELWFTDNGRDSMGDNVPPDELNRVTESGEHFGYPYCHGNGISDPDFGGRPCSQFTSPARELGPHVAALGMTFYTGDMFPEEYRNTIFIAEHGSWNRSTLIGYRVMMVRPEAGGQYSYVPFAEGWLSGRERWGRPVDVVVAPDGSLLVSDDKAGAIYRITYSQ